MENIELLKPYLSESSYETDERGDDNYELLFHAVGEESKEELIDKLVKLLGVSSDKLDLKWLSNNVLCVNITLNSNQVKSLLAFNPLRSMFTYESRDLSSADADFDIIINDKEVNVLTEEEIATLPWVGIIDGGVRTSEKAFSTVEQLYEVGTNPSNKFIEHGTSVASVVLYGT